MGVGAGLKVVIVVTHAWLMTVMLTRLACRTVVVGAIASLRWTVV